ncbi:hypothetical protein GVX76_03435 [[Haemophilus] felis]|nr:hypothetical protein [[Haemophilus] felis]
MARVAEAKKNYGRIDSSNGGWAEYEDAMSRAAGTIGTKTNWREYDRDYSKNKSGGYSYIGRSSRASPNNHLSSSPANYIDSNYSRKGIISSDFIPKSNHGLLNGGAIDEKKATLSSNGLASSNNLADPRTSNDHHSQATRDFLKEHGFVDYSELEGFKKDTYKNRDAVGRNENTESAIDKNVNKSFLNAGHSYSDQDEKKQERYITSYFDHIDEKVGGKRIGDYSLDEYKKAFIQGELARINNINRENLISGAANAVISPIANKASSAAFKALGGGSKGILGGIASGIGAQAVISAGANELSHLGNDPSSDLSELEKSAFRHGYDDLGNNLKSRRSALGNAVQAIFSAGIGIATGTPITSTFADSAIDIMRDNYNVEEYLKEHQHIPEYKNLLEQRKLQRQKSEEARKEKEKYKNSNVNRPTGILPNMLKKANYHQTKNYHQTNQTDNKVYPTQSYLIPGLDNLWQNLIIE